MTLRILPFILAAAFAAPVLAKLPAPDDAAKAKAAEVTAKAGWQAKVDAYQLCKAQDKVAARFRKTAATPTPAAAPAAAGAPPATACSDPGPFATNPPEQKPLETSGAHSPAGTAASPPSVRPESATMAPAKKP